MQDVIDLLLQKKATLTADRDKKVAGAIEKIELEFAERAEKIDELLTLAGYVEPLKEVAEEVTAEEVIADETAEAEEVTAETNAQIVY